MTQPVNQAKQQQSLMRASEHIIQNIREWRRVMTNPEVKAQKAAWGLGGLVITITSQAMAAVQDVIEESAQSPEAPDVVRDLEEVRKRINEVIDKMLDTHVTHD